MLRSLNWWKLTVLLVVVAVSSLIEVTSLNRTVPPNQSDLFVRVVGTRDALKGMNPYSAAVMRDIQTAFYGRPLGPKSRLDPQHFDYPALIVPLLAPFVGFSWPSIRLGFLFLVIPGLLLSSFWWMRILQPSARTLTYIAVVGLTMLAWPTVWGLWLQQPTMVIAILIGAGCFALVRRADWIAGVCMAVALVKPQVSLPLALWLLVWSLRQRRWRFVAGFGFSLVALLAATEYMVPGWFPAWVGTLGSYATLTPVCEKLFGKWMGLTATVLLGLWSIRLLWGMLDADSGSERFGKALALALAATVLIIPVETGMIYDQVFLIPAVLVLIFSAPLEAVTDVFRRLTLMFVGWEFLCVVVAALVAMIRPDFTIPPGVRLWMILPSWGQSLAIILLVALLMLAEEQDWSSNGLKRLWRGRRAEAEAAV